MPVAKIAQHALEVVESITAKAQVSQQVVEVIEARFTMSPTTPTGAGVSQRVVEVLMSGTAPARVTQVAVEVLMSGDGSSGGGSGTPVTHAFGWTV